MKAIVIRNMLDMAETKRPLPVPSPGQVRVRMAYSGICGSDLHYYFHGANGPYAVREPLIPGHELSGTVDLDPSGDLAPGTPVAIHPATPGAPDPALADSPHLWPGGRYMGSASTWPHTQGGMSEYTGVRKDMLRVLPRDLPLRRAALAEPLAVALHALNVGEGVFGKRVLVSGAGAIGLLTAAAALIGGAREVIATDMVPEPLRRARELGVHGTVQIGVTEPPRSTFDVVFECTGNPSGLDTAVRAARPAGIVVLVGMLPDEDRPMNLSSVVPRELQLRGAFRFNDEFDEAIALLTHHPFLDQIVTHVLPAHRVVDAFELAHDARASGKVLLSLWNDTDADTDQVPVVKPQQEPA